MIKLNFKHRYYRLSYSTIILGTDKHYCELKLYSSRSLTNQASSVLRNCSSHITRCKIVTKKDDKPLYRKRNLSSIKVDCIIENNPISSLLKTTVGGYSHSIVEGGLLVTSYTMRLTWSTSLTIRTEIFCKTSHGIRAKSAVMPSIEVTARIPTV